MSDISTNETADLIASDKVEGTAVYDPSGERLGSIANVMIGKRDGQVEYAVMSFGGFLGIGNDHYPIPWKMLTYSTDQGGYVIDIDKSKLNDAPRYDTGNEPVYDDSYANRVNSYYGSPTF